MVIQRKSYSTTLRTAVSAIAVAGAAGLVLTGCSQGAGSGDATTTVTQTTAADSASATASTSTESSSSAAPQTGAFDAQAVTADPSSLFQGMTFTNYGEEYAGLSDNERTDIVRRGQQQLDNTNASSAECVQALNNQDYITSLVAKDPQAINVVTWKPQGQYDGPDKLFTLVVGTKDAIGDYGVAADSCRMFTATHPVGEMGGGNTAQLNYKTVPIPHINIDGVDSVTAYKLVVWSEGPQEGPMQHHSATVRATKGDIVIIGQGPDESAARKIVEQQLASLQL